MTPQASTRPARKATTKKKVEKSKGPARKKTGCHTCRLRRKKCDETRDERGSCKACSHLHIQCLGFGAKRPDFLKAHVTQLRTLISNFTKRNGMQRGGASIAHEGAEDPPFLMLYDPTSDSTFSSSSSSSSASPSSQRMEVSPEPTDLFRVDFVPPFDDATSSDTETGPQLALNGAFGPSFDLVHQPTMPSLWGSITDYDEIPPHTSDNVLFPFLEESLLSNDQNMLVPSTSNEISLSMSSEAIDSTSTQIANLSYTLHIPPLLQANQLDSIMLHYMNYISRVQYPFADDQERQALFGGVSNLPAARESIRLLSDVFIHHCSGERHNYRFLTPNPAEYEGIVSYGSTLEEKTSAALTLISCFLFDGGRGAWEGSLNTAYQFVKSLGGFQRLISQPFTRFLVTTTIRFDVLGSITTMTPPKCMSIVQEICKPVIYAFPDGTRKAQPSVISMFESHMACENSVVWALAETSALAWKKQEDFKKGSLNMKEILAKGEAIQAMLDLSNGLDPTDNLDMKRWQTAYIFRLSVSLYIQSVLWDDRPGVKEVADQVDNLEKAFRHIEVHNNVTETVNQIIRSTVFPTFLCASLCRTEEQFEYFTGLLRRQEGAGNCGLAERMLRQLRPLPFPSSVCDPVPWRQLLNSEKMLLV